MYLINPSLPCLVLGGGPWNLVQSYLLLKVRPTIGTVGEVGILKYNNLQFNIS